MQYAWALKGMGRGVDPQDAGKFIEELEEKYHEHLTVEEILAAARSSRAPVHKLFTWDENDAAEKCRRREARTLMRNLVLAKRGKPTRNRAFVFVKHGKHKRHVYINIRSALGRPDLREQVIQQALKPLQGWVTRYGGRSELRFVSNQVERLRKRIEAELLLVSV